MSTFGDYLKRERTLRNIGLDEIAKHVKIKIDYLRALEGNRYEELPNQAYVKGYIRAYSDYLGLKTDEVIMIFHDFLKKNTDKEKSDKEKRKKRGFFFY
jgi:cytoskeletal protein RodZ